MRRRRRSLHSPGGLLRSSVDTFRSHLAWQCIWSWVLLLLTVFNLRAALQWPVVQKFAASHEFLPTLESRQVLEDEGSVDISELRRQIFDLETSHRHLVKSIEKLQSQLKVEQSRATRVEHIGREENWEDKITLTTKHVSNLFTETVSDFMVGVSRIPANDLLQLFDPGVPHVASSGSDEAWVFYSSSAGVPSSLAHNFDRLNVTEALSKCHSVEIIARHDPPTAGGTCFALVGIPEAGLVPNTHRWLNQQETLDRDVEPGTNFTHAGRGMQAGSDYDFFPFVEDEDLQRQYRKQLVAYLSMLDDTLIPSIQPILESTAIEIDGVGKTLTIMVANAGHADILQNFVCSSKARNFDLSNVVVFCTDAEAEERVKAMGVATIFNAQLFGTSVPKEAAELFGDEAFVAVVYAKLIIAHLVSSLGFSFLLQDVDVIWCADNPMSYFQRDVDLLKNYDMLVQDDGGRTPNYAPYYANSGFYFAKNNEKTKYFFQQLLYNGDKMHDWSSDQAVFNALLPEVVNLAGMSVKTLASDDFAGGRMYQDPDSYGYMREMLTKARTPFVFHMHWTDDRLQKIVQMKQMGMWYLYTSAGQLDECSPEPLIECFHWNRPSVPACQASTIMTNDNRTRPFEHKHRFWTSGKEADS